MNKPEHYVVVSYWPLVDISKPKLFTKGAVQDLQDYLDSTPNVDIIGCLWLMDNDNPIPILVVKRAKELREHMLTWCEKDPGKWFRFCIQEAGEKYILIIYPDIERSIERFKSACLYIHNFLPADDAKYQVICSPLRFFGSSIDNYNAIKNQLSSNITIGFIDADNVDLTDPSSIDISEIHYLTNLKRVNTPDEAIVQLMNQLMDNAEDRSKRIK